MHYWADLAKNIAKAVLWSGGWYWRLPALVALIPSNREPVEPYLKMVGLGDISNWAFGAVGAIALAAVCAVWLSIAITPRIKFGHPTLRPATDGDLIGRLPISLPYGRETARITLRLINLDDTDFDGVEYGLMTERRLQRVLSGEARYAGLINLDSSPKNIEVIRYVNSKFRLVLEHETGSLEIGPNQCFKMKIEVTYSKGRAEKTLLFMFDHFERGSFRLSDDFGGEERPIP